jgi:hypothetical protein
MSDILFSQKDFIQFENKNIPFETIEKQLNFFYSGTKPLNIVDIATTSNTGIKVLNKNIINHYVKLYNKFQESKSIIKFVPASGAASRMFKDLFNFLNNENNDIPDNIHFLISNINKLALYDDLVDFLDSRKLNIDDLISKKNFKQIISSIILPEGLNYANLPKALILFHKYPNHNRTAFEEHIAESVLYANSFVGNKLHFTISPEHRSRFETLAKKLIPLYEKKFDTSIEINFSIQSPSTDTIALTPDNKPFRLDDGSILFRPGGHGALIYNLNNIDKDIIFIKNIDNIVPDNLKKKNCIYKQALAGILLETQQKTFDFINQLIHNPSVETIQQALDFVHNTLGTKIFFEISKLSKTEKIEFLLKKLDRPIRVCGMVKNEGEPGGGPFFVMQKDKTASLQIVEKSQLDLSDPNIKSIFERSQYFNPVDIVLSPRRYNGSKFDLLEYVDSEAAFIAHKSLNGKPLKALELPGLWNGAMADWNTIFVEVPLETFNPVKTIFDLLRPAHIVQEA